jgi:NIMA (never in mitosis gene a)-related kinase
VNTNGVFLVASKLLVSRTVNSASSENTESEHTKEIERLHCNAWRTLRLMFSAERHRSLIKKIIPFNMFEQFVDIGNYKKDLKLYQPLLESFYKLSVSFCSQSNDR